jgi:hypothetical protein
MPDEPTTPNPMPREQPLRDPPQQPAGDPPRPQPHDPVPQGDPSPGPDVQPIRDPPPAPERDPPRPPPGAPPPVTAFGPGMDRDQASGCPGLSVFWTLLNRNPDAIAATRSNVVRRLPSRRTISRPPASIAGSSHHCVAAGVRS